MVICIAQCLLLLSSVLDHHTYIVILGFIYIYMYVCVCIYIYVGMYICIYTYMRGTLLYETEGRGFDSRWCHWNFSLKQSFRPHYGLGVESASNRNEYQEYFLVVKAAGA